MRKLAWSALVVCGVAACSTTAVAPPSDDHSFARWAPVALPGKRTTHYAPVFKDGRVAVEAVAEASASLWRRKVDLPSASLVDVTWSWWVDHPIAGADLSDADRSDAPARVVFAFDGDHAGLSPRNRMMFDLAQALTGERPPYATLMYVWADALPVNTLVVSPRTDRIRKIVIDGGAASMRRWRDHRRNLMADFERAFGEPPGRLISVAVMTDADNTGARARAWYGPIGLLP